MYTNRIISKKYYVNAAGERTYGFAQIGADTYYFHPTTGKMMTGLGTGWQQILLL